MFLHYYGFFRFTVIRHKLNTQLGGIYAKSKPATYVVSIILIDMDKRCIAAGCSNMNANGVSLSIIIIIITIACGLHNHTYIKLRDVQLKTPASSIITHCNWV